MFQLIVAVISIALVAALAIASLYYGGTAFQKGTLKANVTTLVNGGQQISGAYALYTTEHGGVTPDSGAAAAVAITKLTDVDSVTSSTYLASAPTVPSVASGAWTFQGGVASIALVASSQVDVCAEVARQAANGNQFACATTTAGPFNFKM